MLSSFATVQHIVVLIYTENRRRYFVGKQKDFFIQGGDNFHFFTLLYSTVFVPLCKVTISYLGVLSIGLDTIKRYRYHFKK